MLDRAGDIAAGMPEGPEKNTFINYLMLISKALSGLQESLYAMQATQSTASKTQNRAKLDMQLNDIAAQQKGADKIKEATSKMANLGPLGKIFEWIIKIILLVISAFLGPIALIVAAAYFVDSAVSQAQGNKQTYTQNFCFWFQNHSHRQQRHLLIP